MELEDQGKTTTDVSSSYMYIEESTGNDIGGRRNATATMAVRSYVARQNNKCKTKRESESGGISNKVQGRGMDL